MQDTGIVTPLQGEHICYSVPFKSFEWETSIHAVAGVDADCAPIIVAKITAQSYC